MKGLFLTTAVVGPNSGGGIVSFWQLKSLIAKCGAENVRVLSPEEKEIEIPELKVKIKSESINPSDYQMPNIPQAWDWLAFHKVKDYLFEYWQVGEHFKSQLYFDYVFINGISFASTVHLMKVLDEKKVTRVIVDCPAHELQDSIDEHVNVWQIPYWRMYPSMDYRGDAFGEKGKFVWKALNADRLLADIIVCPSQYSVNAIKKIIDFPLMTKFVAIPHGTTIPADVAPLPPNMRFGYCSGFAPDKGPIYLAQAWHQANLKDSELAIAGQGGEQFKEFVEKQLKSDRNFRFLYWMPDLDPFYRAISVLVCPSVTEGFGLCPLEAASHGRMSIISKGAGVHELFTENLDCLKVEPRNVNSLTEKIKWCYDNPKRVEEMGSAARETARKHDWSLVEKQYEKLFE